MESSDLERMRDQLGMQQPWNHNIVLPGGVETRPGLQESHGKNLIKWKRVEPLLRSIRVEDLRVLDIGCNEGYFSLKLADMGAKVLGVDIDEHRIKKARFVKAALGRDDVDFRVVDIYSETFASLEDFDFCLCMGFLHRIPDPYTALAAIARKCHLILFEWKALKHGPHDDSFAYFSPKGIDRQDLYGTEYWLMSYATVESILRRLGFSHFHRLDDPTQRRAILMAGKAAQPIFDRPDKISVGNRVLTLLRHTKSYVKTVGAIISGRINS